MLQPDLTLVHGLFAANHSALADIHDDVRIRRGTAFTEHAEAMGVCSYKWMDGHGKILANRMLRLFRGTARTVDAVETVTLNEEALRESLAGKAGRGLWQAVAGCAPYPLDVERSFILIGAPRQLFEGPDDGMRVLWFGNGLSRLSTAEFVAHYTTHHGPLVAGHGEVIGLRRYTQVPAERDGLCDSLRELGLGQAPGPTVFAELVMGAPPLKLATLRARRAATREIEADEKRHIDFSRSMLLLTGTPG